MNSPRELIEKNGFYCSTVHGYSMYPLLYDHRDSVYIEKAVSFEKYDVVLFERFDGQLVLHRIIGFKNGAFLICGDNNFVVEEVKKERIIGKMTEFSRKDKEYKVDNLWYRIYSRVWCFSFFTKRIFKKVYTKLDKNKK